MRESRMEHAFTWKYFERIVVALIQFAVMLVLVRFVAPDEMGIAIICLAIFHIVNSVFVIRLSNALIQKADVDELDFSTALISQLVLATVFYILLYVSTGVVASWLQLDVIVTALRILGVTVFFYAVSSLYTAHMIRFYNHSSLFSINVSSALIAAILCFFLAIFRYGPFAVILWTFFYQLFSVLLMLLFYKWRPRIGFSFHRITNMVNGRWKPIMMSVVDALFTNGQKVAIGYVFHPAALSFYVRGERLPGVFMQQFTQGFHDRLLLVFAKVKDDTLKLHLKMREMVVLSGFVIVPLMTILLVTAEQLILFMFSERWLFAVPYMQIFCVYYAFLPISAVFSQTFIALDLTDQSIKLNFINKGILLLLWLINFPLGLQAVALSMIGYIIISLFLNSYFLKTYINYSMVHVMKDLAPIILISSTMGVLIYLLHYILPSSFLLIVIQFVIGALLYGTLAFSLKLQAWKLLVKVAYEIYVRFIKRRISRENSTSI